MQIAHLPAGQVQYHISWFAHLFSPDTNKQSWNKYNFAAITKHTTELFRREIYTLVCYIQNKAD